MNYILGYIANFKLVCFPQIKADYIFGKLVYPCCLNHLRLFSTANFSPVGVYSRSSQVFIICFSFQSSCGDDRILCKLYYLSASLCYCKNDICLFLAKQI